MGVLANRLVTLGAVFASRSTAGKVVAIWLPIMTFFGLGYEHSVVNMFVMPAGMLAGAPITVGAWWVWNQVPATVGNILGGAGCAPAWPWPGATAAKAKATGASSALQWGEGPLSGGKSAG